MKVIKPDYPDSKIKRVSAAILLFLLVLTACTPAALSATSTPIPNTPTDIPNTPTEIPPTSTEEPTSTPMPEPVVYPYYLPLVVKPEVAPQTINGVTAQIDWAYADEGRIAIHYTVSGLDWPDGSYMDPMLQVQMKSPVIPELDTGAMGGNRSLVEDGVITSDVSQMLIDGALDQKKNPNVRVRVSIPVEGPEKVGTFRFDLDLPVRPGIKMENIDQTVVQNNVAMTLRSLRLTPSYAETILCFQMPSPVDWGLMASKLMINGKEYPVIGGEAVPGEDGEHVAVDDRLRCSSIGFDIADDETADSITLTVPKLTSIYSEVVTQERVDRANQLLADTGIVFQYVNQDHGGTIEVLKRPEGKTDQEIYPLIQDALSDQYEGPWVFTIPIQR